MKTLQETFFAALDADLTAADLTPISQPRASNAGMVDIVRAGTFDVVVSFEYHFQAGHNVFRSESPVWPEGGSNPRMFIAEDAVKIGRALKLVLEYATRTAK